MESQITIQPLAKHRVTSESLIAKIGFHTAENGPSKMLATDQTPTTPFVVKNRPGL